MITIENITETERALLVDLLNREEGELPVEIRHTRNSIIREELHIRAKLVHELLDRVRMPTTV
jgi:hypothetical protein